jgi:hypothetical protein
MRRFLLLLLAALAPLLPARAALPLIEHLYHGQAVPFYAETSNPELSPILSAVKRAQLAERMAAVVNGTLRMKSNIGVGFASCGQENAFYDHNRHAITVCLEFIRLVATTAKSDTEFMMKLPREQLAKGIDGLLWSVYFHELAHALIDINGIPVTGREEDVADQFSFWYATTYLDPKQTPVVTPAIWFWGRMAKSRNLSSLSDDQLKRFLANEHSLDDQRVFNLACLMVGMNPQSVSGTSLLVQLPEERARKCPREYEQMQKSMHYSFQKFVKARPVR